MNFIFSSRDSDCKTQIIPVTTELDHNIISAGRDFKSVLQLQVIKQLHKMTSTQHSCQDASSEHNIQKCIHALH